MKGEEGMQLELVFADSQKWSEQSSNLGAPRGTDYLLHITSDWSPTNPTAERTRATAATLGEVAALPTLAKALLQIARNKGAAGVDGKSVDEVVSEAHRILPKLRSMLLSGQYRPGDVKRVWMCLHRFSNRYFTRAVTASDHDEE